MLIILLLVLTVPVSAMDITPPSVPSDAEELMPAQTENFGQGLWTIIKAGVEKFAPQLTAAIGTCMALTAVVLLASILNATPGNSKKVVRYVTTLALTTIMLGQANTLINLCAETVRQITEYGKLLLPNFRPFQRTPTLLLPYNLCP